MKGKRCGDTGARTHDLSGLLGGLNPPEGLRMTLRGDWRQGGEVGGDNPSGSEKNLSQALTQGSLRSLRRLQGQEGSQIRPGDDLLVRSILPSVPETPTQAAPSFVEMNTSLLSHVTRAPPLVP